MLKDVRDSRRVTTYVKDANRIIATATKKKDDDEEEDDGWFSVQAYILSGEYWPEFHREQFKLPEELDGPFAQFTR